MGVAAAGGPFRSHPSTYFIDSAELFGLRQCSCRLDLAAKLVDQF